MAMHIADHEIATGPVDSESFDHGLAGNKKPAEAGLCSWWGIQVSNLASLRLRFYRPLCVLSKILPRVSESISRKFGLGGRD